MKRSLRLPYVTSSGLQIGICHVPRRPLHTFTGSEEAVQRALLAPPTPARAAIRPVLAFLLAVALGVGGFLLFTGI